MAEPVDQGEESPQHGQEPVRLHNLLLVTLLLTIFHFGLYHALAQEELLSGVKGEWARVESALGEREPPGEETHMVVDLKEWLLRLPILALVDRTSKKNFYHMTEVPLGLRALNSLAAAILMHMLGLVIVQILPEQHRLRRFFEGRGLREKDALPRQLDRVRLFRIARQLESLEERRLGPVTIIALFHFMLTYAANLFDIGSRLSLDVHRGPNPFISIMRFPLTPLLVRPDFWDRRFVYPVTPFVITLANSFAAALVLLLLRNLASRRK